MTFHVKHLSRYEMSSLIFSENNIKKKIKMSSVAAVVNGTLTVTNIFCRTCFCNSSYSCTDHFETLHMFSSWYEDEYVVWI